MKRSKHTLIKRIGLVLGVVAIVLVAGICFVASKLRGDEEVITDIDRHFQSLEGSSEEVLYGVGPDGMATGGQDGLLAAGALASNDTGKGKTGKSKRRRQKGAKGGSSKTGKPQPATPWKGVRKIAPGTYLIDQKLAVDAQRRPKAYVQGVTARLVARDGKPLGFQLANVSPVSPIYAIGLRSGDVLLAVNGFKLKTIDEALLAATSLRFANQYRVDILRGGNQLSFYYRIAGKA